MKRFRWRSLSAGLMSFVMFVSVVALASQADGRVATRAESNDGGAWLVDRLKGGTAHVEHSSRLTTAGLSKWDARSELSAIQAPGVVAIVDRSTSTVAVIDPANAIERSRTQVPEGATVVAVPAGLVVSDTMGQRLWRRGVAELAGLSDFGSEPSDAVFPGKAVVGVLGDVAVVGDGSVVWPYVGDPGEPASWLLPEGFDPKHLTMAASRLVLVDGSQWLVGNSEGFVSFESSRVASLSVPSTDPNLVGFVGIDGQIGLLELSAGQSVSLGGPGPVNTRPVLLEECVFVLSGPAGAVEFWASCFDGVNKDFGLLPIEVDAQLREVNGFVWVDALDGSGFVVSPDLEMQEIADFSDVFDDSDGEESADGENVKEQLDQTADDAGLTDADERTNDDENEPPIAEDDEAATRAGRPVLVDVLYNDSDPDSDVILVDRVEPLSGEAIIEIPTSRNGVQVTPTGGPGQIAVRYWISDGHPGGEDSAVITLDVLELTQDNNRPPETGLDRAVGATSAVVSLNLLLNDSDPDGDSIVLVSVGPDDSGSVSVLSVHPGGDVLLSLPASVSDGTITIPYIIEDEWHEQAEGQLQLEMRIEGSNTPPDARNDAGITQVGRVISLNLLDNDADSDNDLLAIGQPATYLGEGDPGGLVSTNEDGEFIFEPTRAGTFVFEYSATDSIGSDLSIVRIEVTEPTENRPPVAVRDDVTLALGESRLIRALENDGDADGDLFAVIDQTDNDNLKIVEEKGVGFWVSMKPSASPVETFQYRLSDGHSESNLAMVVVARSDQSFTDAAPIANDDVARVRAGRSSWVNVIQNDYDPEGGPVTITEVESTEPLIEASVGSQGQNVTVKVPVGTELPFALTYVITDSAGNIASANVQVAIVPEGEVNSAPVARPDFGYTVEEEVVLIPVLANDSDPESDAFEVIGVPRSPTGGTAVLSEDQKAFIYTPTPGFTGTDQFTYLLRDSQGGESTGFVSVGVMPKPHVNTPPVATPDLEYVFAAGAGSVALRVLDNDSDADDDPLTIISSTGQSSISANGKTVTFPIPASVESQLMLGFSYEISDGRGGTDEAEVLVTVLATEVDPIPPVANPDAFGPVKEGEEVSINVVANDEDPDGDPAALVVSSAEPGVSVVGNKLVLTAPGESGEFAYTITDPDGLSDSSFVTVSVEPNLPPEVQSPVHLGEYNTDETIPVINLADYASDPDGDELVFSSVSSWVGGTTRLDLNTSDARVVTFIPSEGFKGEAGFAFTVEDGHGHTVTGRVSLTLLGLSNEAPEGQDLTVTLEAGVAQPINFAGLFTDPDMDDVLSYEMVSQPGSPVIVEATGPDSIRVNSEITAASGETSFVVRATDPDGETAEATVTIRVTESLIGPPEAGADSAETNQEQAVTVDVLANDLNTLGTGALTIINAFSAEGTTTISGPNITFTPNSGFFGTATVQYTIADERNRTDGEAIGLLTVDVVGRPAAPVGLSAEPLPPRSIGLGWLAPANNGAPIESYDIELDGSVSSVGTSPSHNFNSLEPGVDHTFRVRAVNKAGEGEWSVSVTALVDQTPGAPGKPAVTISANAGELLVSWAPAVSEGSDISGYNLEISQCDSQTISGLAGTTFPWTGLTNGTRCAFSVTATNLAGDSLPSPISNLECPVGIPIAPGQPGAVRGDKQAEVSWSQPENPDCETLIGYEIVRSPALTTPVPAGTLQWTSSPLENGQSYTYQVRAQNRAGWSDLSPSSVPVIPCGVPLAPSAPVAVRGDTLAVVTHSSDADANGCAISQYQVSYNGGGWSQLAANGNVTGLTNGTEYTFRVRGINEIGDGEPSPVSNAVTPIGPPGPVVALGMGSNAGSIAWEYGEADYNGAVSVVYLASGNISGSPYPMGIGGNLDNWSVDCLVAGHECLTTLGGNPAPPTACAQTASTVSATVWASNDAGVGPTRTGSYNLAGCPGAPSLTVTGGNGQYTANWSRPNGTDRIYIQVNSGYGSPVGGSSKVFTGNNGQTYQVTAWACNELGCSKSPTRSVTPVRPVTIALGRGGVFVGGSCGANSGCRYVTGSVTGFTPNARVHIACGDFVDTSRNIPVVYSARYVDGNGNFGWGDGICGSSFSHSVRVWTGSGDSVTGTVAAP